MAVYISCFQPDETEKSHMLSQQENELMTRIGPGTPMGQLLRRYWYPVAATSELVDRPTKAVRILGEDLVLYRDKKGRPGLIGSQCAHRRMSMRLCSPEEEGLRCAYHGWLYDRNGKCLEQPYEQAEDPGNNPGRSRGSDDGEAGAFG